MLPSAKQVPSLDRQIEASYIRNYGDSALNYYLICIPPLSLDPWPGSLAQSFPAFPPIWYSRDERICKRKLLRAI